MLLGARLGMSGGAAWVNPYITNGLIAMWDGVWNFKGGEHDSTSTIWKDLSGNGYDITKSSGTWNADSITLAQGGYLSVTLPSVSRPAFTAEVVYSKANNQRVILWIGNPSWVGGLLMSYSSSNYYYPWTALSFTPLLNTKNSESLCYQANDQRLYSGASLVASKSGTVDSRNILTRLQIGAYNGNSTTGEYTIHCVRLYDRALTAAEVAANYAIDKARFGL